jgi:outer membrane lipoprotein-sorting protein
MKRAVMLLSVVALALAVSAPAWAQTADDVVEKHLAALGGRAGLAKLTSQVATGTVVVSSQVGDLSGPVEIYHKAPNKSRTLIRLDLSALGASEVVVDQRCDGQKGFASNSMQGDREITGNQLQGMVNAIFPTPLLAYKDLGSKIELVGKDKVGERPALVIQYTPKAGPSSKMFFDAETYQLVRAITTMEVPEAGGALEQTSEFRDFRTVDGLSVPFAIHIASNVQTVGITLSKVEINKTLDDAMFVRPAK